MRQEPAEAQLIGLNVWWSLRFPECWLGLQTPKKGGLGMRNEGGELAKLCGGCWTTKTTTTTDAISWRNRSSINGIQQLRHWKQLTNKKLLADNDEDDTTTDRAFERWNEWQFAPVAYNWQPLYIHFTLHTGATRRGHDKIGQGTLGETCNQFVIPFLIRP